jgi:class 3 adenylate cyclase/predicted ATPase
VKARYKRRYDSETAQENDTGMAAPEIADWLVARGLGEFTQLFIDQQIEPELLPDLTDADLQSIGLPLGARKKLLRAIAAWRQDAGTPQAAAAPMRPTPPPRRGAERRNLTVLVCDMVGSTALASRLDPEELRGIMHGYMDACTAVVASFGGYVARYQGDGLMAYFGYPQAREDAAERAVRAALRLIDTMRTAPADPAMRLQTRIGIATGLAVVGDLIGEGAAREEAVVGETPALAVRLESIAPSDGVVIAQSTRELLGHVFALDDLGLQSLKGFDRPQRAWRVIGEARAESRFAAVRRSRPDGLPVELVGRDSELAVLLTRWRRAVEGAGQTTLLIGEPGLGKSRLVEALREALAGDAPDVVLLQCASHHQASALRPVIEWIERTAGFAPDDPAEMRLERLKALPDLAGPTLEVVAELLSVVDAAEISQAERRERTLNALIGLLTQGRAGAPRLLVFEDVHWSDAFSLELLERIVDAAGVLPLMVLVTTRPETSLSWSGAAAVTTITLDRLEPVHATRLVDQLGGADRLQPELRERIIERAGGVPLFVEELTRSMLEAGEDAWQTGRSAGAVPVPATLHDTLMARLDRLGEAKAIAQIGAVLGRAFHYRWLASCAGVSAQRLHEALTELVGSGLAAANGAPPEAIYSFKHALVQDAAYHSMLRAERVRLHREIARILESRFIRIAEEQPELLAHHYTEAAETDLAITWWERASSRAWSRAASVESSRHLRRALDLLAGLPAGAGRDEREIVLRRALVGPLVNLGGYSSPETEENLDRLGVLLEDAPPNLEAVVLLYTQSAMRLLRSDLDRVGEVAQRTLRLARRSEIPNTPMLGQRILGYTALLRGDVAEAETWFTESFDEYDPSVNRGVWPGSPHDPLASMLAQDVLLLLQQGRLDEAARRGRAAWAEAERLQSPTTLAYVLVHLGLAALVTGDAAAAGAVAPALAAVVDRVAWLRGHAEVLQGWLLGKSGAVDAGIAQIRQARETAGRIQDRMWWPLFLLCEAELLIEAARFEEALATLTECRRMIELTGQSYVRPEVYRQRAVALGGSGAAAREVEAALETALNIARRQGLRFYELRAATSLARFWMRTGRVAEAQALLAPVAGGFTEGRETAELREAEAVLGQLAVQLSRSAG